MAQTSQLSPARRAVSALLIVALTSSSLSTALAQTVATRPPVQPANRRTSLDVTPAGTPIVNIATPDRHGTSHNIYDHFSVGREGLIFNNSATTGSSALGGTLIANPNLTRDGKAAQLILNEVTGGTRTTLAGPMEVFGPTAALVIANPTGITCDGCGFINIGRVTLSSGRPSFASDGSFAGLIVEGGDVAVQGQGLLAGDVDYFDIVAGAAHINASLYARDLVVAAGPASFDYASRTVTGRGTATAGLSLDSSLLGGMYANRIRLVGTGDGVGVNLKGTIASLQGALEITADGQIVLERAVAGGDATLVAADDIRIGDQFYAAGNIRASSGVDIIQAGSLIGAGQDVTLAAGRAVTLGGASLYAGLGEDGLLDQPGRVDIRAAAQIHAPAAQILASDELRLAGADVVLGTGSRLWSKSIRLTAAQTLDLAGEAQSLTDAEFNASRLQLSGSLIANQRLLLDAPQLLLEGRAVGLEGVAVDADAGLSLGHAGSLQTNGETRIVAGTIDNGGQILAVNGLTATAGRYSQTGELLSGGALSLEVAGDVSLGGTTWTNALIAARSGGTLQVTGEVAAGGSLTLNAGAIDLPGTLLAGGDIAATAQTTLTSGSSSLIVSDGNLLLSAHAIETSGLASATGALTLSAEGELTQKGALQSGRGLTLKASDMYLAGQAVSNGALSLLASGEARVAGSASAQAGMTVRAGNLRTDAGAELAAGGALDMRAARTIAHQGTIAGNGLSLIAGTDLTSGGTLFSSADLDVSAGERVTLSAASEAIGAMHVEAADLDIGRRLVGLGGVVLQGERVNLGEASDLQSGGTLTVAASRNLALDGSILAQGSTALTSGGDFEQGARISLGGTSARLTAAGALTLAGSIETPGDLVLEGASITGSGGVVADDGLVLQSTTGPMRLAGQLSSLSGIEAQSAGGFELAGALLSGGGLEVRAADIGVSGTLQAGSAIHLKSPGTISLGAGSLIAGNHNVRIDAGSDLAADGILSAAGAVGLSAAGRLAHAGSSEAASAITLAAQSLDLAGSIASQDSITASAEERLEISGTLSAVDDGSAITLNGAQARLASTAGLAAQGAILVHAGDIETAARLDAGSIIDLAATSRLQAGGTLVSGGAISLTAATSLEQSGIIEAAGALTLEGDDVILSGQGLSETGIHIGSGSLSLADTALWQSGGDLMIDASGAVAQHGRLLAIGELTLDAGGDVIQTGSLVAGGNLSLSAGGLLTSNGQIEAAGSTSQLSLSGSGLNLTGATVSNGSVEITAGHDGATLGGVTSAATGLRVTAAGPVIAGGDLLSDGALDLEITGTLETLASARLIAGDAVTLRTDDIFTHGGLVSAGGSVDVAAARVESNGVLKTVGPLNLSADSVRLDGRIVSNAAVDLTARQGPLLLNGEILAAGLAGRAAIGNVEVGPSAILQSSSTLDLTAAGSLQIDGLLAANQAVTLGADGGTLTTGSAARLETLDALTITARDVIDHQGAIEAVGDVHFTANRISSRHLLTDGALRLAATSDIAILGETGARGAVDLSSTVGGIVIAADAGVRSAADQISLTVGQGLDNAGQIVGQAGVTATAATHINNHGVIAAPDGLLQLSASKLALGGTVLARALDGRSDSDLTVSGTLETLGLLSLSGGNLAVLNGAAIRSAAALSLDAAQARIDGALSAATMLDLRAENIRLGSTGEIGAGGRLSLIANNALESAGRIITGDALTLTGARLQLAGSSTAARQATLSAAEIDVAGLIEAGGPLVFNGNDVVINGSGGVLRSVDTLGINAGRFTNAGLLEAGGAIRVTATGPLASTGTIRSNDSITLDTPGLLSLGGRIEGAGHIAATGGALTSQGQMVTNGNLSLIATAGDLTLAGTLASQKTLTLKAVGHRLDIGATAEAFGAAGVQGEARAINTAGTLASDAAVSLAAVGDLTQSGQVTADGQVRLTAGGAINLPGRIDAADLQLAASTLAVDGVVRSSGRIDINSGATQIGGSIHAAGDIVLTRSGAGLVLGSGGEIVTAATLDFGTLGDMRLAGLASAGEDIKARWTGTATLGGRVEAGRDIALSFAGTTGALTGTTLDLEGTLAAGRDLALDGGVVRVSGLAISGHNFSLHSSSYRPIGTSAPLSLEVTGGGRLAAGGGLDVSLLGGLEVASGSAITAVGSATLSAAAHRVAGSVAAGGTLVLSSHDNLAGNTAPAFSLGGTARLESGGALTLTAGAGRRGEAAAGSNLIANGSVAISAGNLDLRGTIAGAGQVGFTAGANMTLGGLVQSGQRIVAQAGNALDVLAGARLETLGNAQTITLARNQLQGANIALAAGGLLHNAGTLYTDGSIALTGGSGIQNSGAISAARVTVLQADSAAVTNPGTITGAAVGIFQGRDFTNSGSYVAAGDLLINAPNIFNAGLIGAGGDLGLEAGGLITNQGTLFAGADLSLTAGTRFHNDQGLVLAVGSITLDAPTLINESGRIEALSGDVVISTANLTNRIKTLTITRSADGSTDVVSQNSGAAQIAAARDITINAAGGTVTNSNSSILAGRNISITTGTLNNVADLLRTTRTIQVPTGDIIHQMVDVYIDCPATAIPGSCRYKNTGPDASVTYTYWDEYEVVSQTVTEEVPLPTQIRAGGTVSISASQINNGTISSNSPYLGTGDPSPDTSQSGASALGGRATSSAPAGPGTGLVASVGAAASAGTQAGAATSGYALTGNYKGQGPAVSADAGAGAGVIGTVAGPGLASGSASLIAASAGTPVAVGAAAGAGPTLVAAAGADAAAAVGAVSLGLTGTRPGAARLIDGFAGFAIPGVIGANGEAGQFVHDFLRQFGLSADGSGGLGFAGGGGLFTYNDAPNADYLFSMNRGFGDTAALFDSDYFFDRLAVDRGTHFTRLGDGFFEAQLISQQVRAATGLAQLPQFGSALEQAAALMEEAVRHQSALGLTLGVALTAEQVAALSQPMVWWVKSTIGGREVLVPVVYLASAGEMEMPDQVLIAGSRVVAEVEGDLRNAGRIAGHELVSLTAGNDILNAQGSRVTGGTIVASAARDLLNGAGSAVSGTDVWLEAGRDLALASTTTTFEHYKSASFGKHFSFSNSTTSLVTGGAVGAEGTLVLSAGRDLTLGAGSALSGTDVRLEAGRDLALTSTTTTTDLERSSGSGKGRWSNGTSSTSQVTGVAVSANNTLGMSAGRDLSFEAARVEAGGHAALAAGGDLTITAVTATNSEAQNWRRSKKDYGATTLRTETATGAQLDVGGDLALLAGGALGIQGSAVSAGGGLLARGGEGISIGSVLLEAEGESSGRRGKTRTTETLSGSTNVLSTVAAGGDLVLATPGALEIRGATVAAEGALQAQAGNIAIGGVIDTASMTLDSVRKSSGLLSKKKKYVHKEASNETVIGSTVSGGSVSLDAVSDVLVAGSALVARDDLEIVTGGDVAIAAMSATDTNVETTRVKKSGLSLGGSGLFIGAAKTNSDASSSQTTNTGSVVGSASGDVTIVAGDALSVSGSKVAGTQDVTLAGRSVAIEAVTGSFEQNSYSKSSSAGLSIAAYENVSAAAKSVANLADRIGDGGQGTAGTAVTAASETIRTVNAVINAVTNAAGVSATLGFSKSKSVSESRGETVVGSTIAGGDVRVIAQDDIAVTGSRITGSDGLSLLAGGDILVQSAEEWLEANSNSKSSGASVGVSIGVSMFGTVSASASASVSSSKTQSTSNSTRQVNSHLETGGTLTLVSGGDTRLAGATAEGRDVRVETGGDLILESRQDVTTAQNSSSGFNAGVSLGTSGPNSGSQWGGSFGLSAGKGHTDAAVVAEQTALVARGGSLEATVDGTTRLDGALIAAVDEAGADSGELRLSTGRLEVSDIADRVDTRQVSAGISTSINDITKSGVAGANTPVLDGSYARSDFRQETRGTIGAGEIIVADADGGTPVDEINRDIAAAQQVTKDSQSGFTLYLNDSAIRETAALITGDSQNSTILQGAEALATDPLAAARGLVAEVKSLADDVPESGSLETLGGKVNSLFPGYAERSAKASGRAVEIAMIKAGLSPEQASQGKKYLEAKGVLAAEGELKQALHDVGTERGLPPERIERVAAEIRAFQEKGDTSPAAQQQLAERIAAVAPEIVVTGQAVNGPFDKVLSLAVKTTEALGEAVNTAPEWMKEGIVAAGYVLGGVQGVVTNLATDLSGAGAYLEKGTELLTVGVDSLLRRDSFAQVYGENQDKSSDNPTFNQTTGIGIVGSVILPGVGKAVLKGRRAHRDGSLVSDEGALTADLPSGSFSISDWSGYPANMPRPDGPFRLLTGDEYNAAREAANDANRAIRKEQGLVGQAVDVHEVQPVKFGGSPTDPENKVLLPRDVHRKQVTPWWNKLQKDLENVGSGRSGE